MNDTGPSIGQFLVTHEMKNAMPVFDVLAFEMAIALREEQLRGLVHLTIDVTPIGTLYQWRPVI